MILEKILNFLKEKFLKTCDLFKIELNKSL